MRYFHIPTIPFFSPAHVFLCDMIWILHNSKRAREIFCKDWDPISAMQISMHGTLLCSSSRRITFFVHLQGQNHIIIFIVLSGKLILTYANLHILVYAKE